MDEIPIEFRDAITKKKESFARKVRFFESVSRSPSTTLCEGISEEPEQSEVNLEKKKKRKEKKQKT